jgi:hypothetical protein
MAAEIGGKGKRCRSNSEIELTGLGDWLVLCEGKDFQN